MPVRAKPYKHQLAAYHFVNRLFGLTGNPQASTGAALLMEMGCGKTLTTIGIIGRLSAEGKIRRVLIVAPLSIVSVWRDELEKFAGFDYDTHILQGSLAKKTEALKQLSNDSLQIVIVNYESAWRLEEQLTGYAPDMIVVDEAHKLKTHNTKQPGNRQNPSGPVSPGYGNRALCIPKTQPAKYAPDRRRLERDSQFHSSAGGLAAAIAGLLAD
jgi:SNF2 family DNA or RNA helicase